MPTPIFALPSPAVSPPALDRFQAAIISYSPWAFFKCDEASGDLYDYLGRFKLAKVGTPTYRTPAAVPGERGGIGVTSSGSFDNSANDIGNPGTPVTIGAWANFATTTSDGDMFGAWATNGIMLYSTAGVTRLYAGGTNIGIGSGTFGLHLYVGTWDGTTAILYIDGSSVASGAVSGALTLGARWGINHYSNGQNGNTYSHISNCFILNRSLSASQVKRLYDVSQGR